MEPNYLPLIAAVISVAGGLISILITSLAGLVIRNVYARISEVCTCMGQREQDHRHEIETLRRERSDGEHEIWDGINEIRKAMVCKEDFANAMARIERMLPTNAGK